MSTLAERFREFDRADAYARSLGRDDPGERAAWDAVGQLVEDLHGDPRDTAPSWAARSWDHTDPTDPAVREVTHDGPRVMVESGTGDHDAEVFASMDVTTQPGGSRKVSHFVTASVADSLTPAAARRFAAALLDAADLAERT